MFAALCLVLACTACSKPAPPDKDRPPEPTAQAERPYGNPHALRDSIQAPINKAKSAEAVTLEAAKQQQASIDAQMAGEDPAAATTQ
ncbi:hypothetical protein LYSHEL_10460 [Lysobacter helvus]|uniref:Lipoprotein n=3 Tax=Lysobacterales TaxID=135614 RepID=A0ABM7Q3Z8_9GAMM|nr:hypothetical protein LYSCAS_10460 [Lysobacter caseinilyticus]BCT95175.1 hypothetical protein LYSHEL_10460 [Lysobacter helvus]